MKSKIFVLAVVAAALYPAAGNAGTMRGVVVAKSHGTLLVATSNGAVRSVHGNAFVGARVVGPHVVGRASRAHLHGVVVKRVGATAFLSSNRHLLAVHSTDPTPAAPGSVVDTTVTVQPNGELDDENENEVGSVDGSLQISATITAVGAGTVTLSVNAQTVTLSLPNGLTLPATVVGQTVTFAVALGRGGNEQGDDNGGDNGGDGGGDD
jgi:hypothetical protein